MRGAFVIFLVTVVVAGCGDDAATTTTAAPAETAPAVAKPAKQLVVHETEFRLDPARVPGGDVGLVSIKIVNDGKVAHALAVDGPNGEVELDGRVEPGATATLEADLDKPGTYTMYCPLDGHRAKGMSGTITVGGSSPARGAEPTGTTTPTTSTTPTQTQTTTQTTTQTQTQTHTVTTPTATDTTPTATTGTPSSGGSGY
ncbi:MAG TPA: cupredoxin domain-containing protein [Thermoleophilaceae bacterium]|nr:cupredoxin domain-containing protein [Thermoleophilaceae bacterium]